MKRDAAAAIDSAEVLYSAGSNDECYTPDYGVAPILKYVPKDAVVWCPFDSKTSEFVKQLEARGNKVIHSHISEQKDFMTWQPDETWDVIVSNPPFSNKRQTFERALSFNKPFALIMANTWLNDSAPKQLFSEKDLQLLMFEQRMEFHQKDGKTNNKITFSSSYFCWNFLPKQIIMEKLCKPKPAKRGKRAVCELAKTGN
jgi:hypothetical protein